jgi:hypothetical protein
MSIMRKSLILLTFFLLESHAFVPASRSSVTVTKWEAEPATLMAKKKRRKRKDDASGSEPLTDELDFDSGSDELPDFDLDGPIVEDASPKPIRKPASSSPGGEAPITKAQMGKVKPMSSISELLNDRSLEQELSFDVPVADAEELPNFADYVKSSAVGGSEDEPLGKKKARQEARRAAALAAEEEESGGFFSNLPFFGGGDKDETKEKEPLDPIKVRTCRGAMKTARGMS